MCALVSVGIQLVADPGHMRNESLLMGVVQLNGFYTDVGAEKPCLRWSGW